MNKRIFVYGTLRKGFHNNYLLQSGTLLGQTQIKGRMYSTFQGFPYVSLQHEDHVVIGEVYKIDDDILERCDRLEGYRPLNPESSFYDRTLIKTPLGLAYVYHIETKHDPASCIVKSGDWNEYVSKGREARESYYLDGSTVECV